MYNANKIITDYVGWDEVKFVLFFLICLWTLLVV